MIFLGCGSMNRKEIKKIARKNLKRNYFQNLIVVFICSLILAGSFNFTTKNILNTNINDKISSEILNNKTLSNSEIIDQLLNKTEDEKKIEEKINNKFTSGVLSTFVNEITKSGSILFGIINGINKTLFSENIGITVLIIISGITFYLIKIFILNPILIGENRYFLEQRRYSSTKMDKVLFPYRNKKTLKIAIILFLKDLYEMLWWLTIIGGFIKHYEYKMIPYILAENPDIKRKEAFKISKELTYGNKFTLFKLDLSLIGWDILSFLTLNLSKIFYSSIYLKTIYTETYMYLRKNKNIELLNDELLNIKEILNEEYPEEKKELIKTREWLKKIDYNKNYSISTYILLFFTFSTVGWLWEVLLHLLTDGTFVNRGTLHGPWLPIYGFGGILILICLKKFRKNPLLLFLMAFILCGVVEYITAWYLETFNSMKYWDYSGYFLNLHGRICLEGLLVFGLGGCGFTYIFAPILDNLYKKIKPQIKSIICLIFLLTFTLDFMYSSLISPNEGEGISQKVAVLNEI